MLHHKAFFTHVNAEQNLVQKTTKKKKKNYVESSGFIQKARTYKTTKIWDGIINRSI